MMTDFDLIKLIAKSSVIGKARKVRIGKRTMTSAVTATFEVFIELEDGATYPVLVATAVEYKNPVVID